ncbi:hypothetical protein [Nocardia jejuensis]|uniref:hypothetical protein n=1 Tax=Nocardia jejuensis TaxID=328049 RepID=UPI0008322501|nr:hypothetical protein [Nocardia jejuensis]
MRPVPTAIGFLRHDVSGTRQRADQLQIQELARKLGYDLRKTLVFGPDTDRPLTRVRTAVSRLDADAVITPNLEHFDGRVPDDVVRVADLITVTPENTYTRHAPSPGAN